MQEKNEKKVLVLSTFLSIWVIASLATEIHSEGNKKADGYHCKKEKKDVYHRISIYIYIYILRNRGGMGADLTNSLLFTLYYLENI